MRRRDSARQPLQRAAAGAGDHAGQVARLLAADRVVVHHLQRIAGLRHVDARQRAPRAADQIQIAVGALGQPRHGRPGRPRRSRARATGSPPARSASRIAPRLSVCDTPRAPRSSRTSSSEPPPISARMPSARRECRTARRRAEIFRLLRRRTGRGSARRACAPAAPATKSGAVARVAHRGGGQHLERRGAHRAGHRVIAVQHGERLRHALFVQPPGRLQAAAETQHRLLVEDRHRVAARAPRRPRGARSSIRDRPRRSVARRQAA